MMENEHEVYGGDIFPEEGDLDGKPINESITVDGDVVPDDAVSKEELEEMKKRLKEMEEEAAALRDMQAKVEKEMVAGAVQGMFVVRVHFWACFRRLHEGIVKH
jgi:polyadenylate-binding protein 2